jgi:hypothetical protein
MSGGVGREPRAVRIDVKSTVTMTTLRLKAQRLSVTMV